MHVAYKLLDLPCGLMKVRCCRAPAGGRGEESSGSAGAGATGPAAGRGFLHKIAAAGGPRRCPSCSPRPGSPGPGQLACAQTDRPVSHAASFTCAAQYTAGALLNSHSSAVCGTQMSLAKAVKFVCCAQPFMPHSWCGVELVGCAPAGKICQGSHVSEALPVLHYWDNGFSSGMLSGSVLSALAHPALAVPCVPSAAQSDWQ